MACVRPSTVCLEAQLKSVPDMRLVTTAERSVTDDDTFDIRHHNGRRVSQMMFWAIILVGTKGLVLHQPSTISPITQFGDRRMIGVLTEQEAHPGCSNRRTQT